MGDWQDYSEEGGFLRSNARLNGPGAEILSPLRQQYRPSKDSQASLQHEVVVVFQKLIFSERSRYEAMLSELVSSQRKFSGKLGRIYIEDRKIMKAVKIGVNAPTLVTLHSSMSQTLKDVL